MWSWTWTRWRARSSLASTSRAPSPWSQAMSETVTQAADRTTGIIAQIDRQAIEWAKVLPAHLGPEKYHRWALTAVRDPSVAAVMATDEGRLSVMSALMDCASLGLEPGRTYHLVKFGGVVTGIVDYKGEIELITNANPAACVVAMLVREKDTFGLRGANIPPLHEADWFGDRGHVIGGYAYVDFGGAYADVGGIHYDGRYSLVVRMSEAQFEKHRA